MDPDLQWRSLRWPDGSLYEGLTRGDRAESHGVLLFPNRDRYEGQFVDGLMDGYGVYVWADGTVYRGEWMAGAAHGCGVRLRRSPQPAGAGAGPAFEVAEGKHVAGGWVGPIMPCGPEQSTDAAVEADVAASQARSFLTPQGKEVLQAWRQQRAAAPLSSTSGRVQGQQQQGEPGQQQRQQQRPAGGQQARPPLWVGRWGFLGAPLVPLQQAAQRRWGVPGPMDAGHSPMVVQQPPGQLPGAQQARPQDMLGALVARVLRGEAAKAGAEQQRGEVGKQ